MYGLIRYPDLSLTSKVGELFPVVRHDKIPVEWKGDGRPWTGDRGSETGDGK